MDINDNEGYRKEEKYYIPYLSIPLLKRRMEMFADIDKNAKDGFYTVSSIYFDDFQNRALIENEDGNDPRSKWRIRIYNHDFSSVFLENKIKKNGLTYKNTESISEEQYLFLIDKGLKRRLPQILLRKNNLYEAFCAEKAINFLTPKVVVEYERIPYVYNLNTTRITIDYNISCIDSLEDFGKRNAQRHPLLDSGRALLEVKYNGLLPDFVVHIIQELDMEKTANSKYYLSRLSKMARVGV